MPNPFDVGSYLAPQTMQSLAQFENLLRNRLGQAASDRAGRAVPAPIIPGTPVLPGSIPDRKEQITLDMTPGPPPPMVPRNPPPDTMMAGAPQMTGIGGPEGAPPMPPRLGGGRTGIGGRLRNFVGSDAALGLAAGLLQGDTPAEGLGKGFGNAAAIRTAQRKQADPTRTMQEYMYARQQGFKGSFFDYQAALKAAGRNSINNVIGGDSAPGLGKLSPDYGYRLDPETRQPIIDPETGLPEAAPVPGSPAADEAAAAAAAEESRQQTGAQSSDVVLGAIGDARAIFEQNPTWTTGVGGAIMLNIPGSGAVDLQEAIAPIEASIAFDRLQKMRVESPSGGALGAVSERELALLAATISSLKQSQSPEAFRRNLNKVETVYKGIARKFAAYPNAAAYGFAPVESAAPSGGWQDMGNGVRIREMP